MYNSDMKNKLIHLLAIPTIYIFWQYVQLWAGMKSIEYTMRPFVYRMLVPELVDIWMWFGLPKDLSYILTISLSFLGFIVAFKILLQEITGKVDWGMMYVSSWGLILLVWAYSKPYDIMTVFLMTLCYLFIWKQNHFYLALLFPVLCLNRETAFLITLVCAVWFWRKMSLSNWLSMLTYQTTVFVALQGLIRIHYSSAVGENFQSNFWSNLQIFYQHPYGTLALLFGAGLLLYFACLHWNQKNSFLKTSLVVLFPVQILLYLLFGRGYEIRVFAEVYPIVALLIYSREMSNEKIQEGEATKMSSNGQDHVRNRERRRTSSV